MTSLIKRDAYIKLKEEVDSRGLKTSYVARRICITPNYLASIMNGNRNLTTDVAIRASRVLGLPIDYFLN